VCLKQAKPKGNQLSVPTGLDKIQETDAGEDEPVAEDTKKKPAKSASVLKAERQQIGTGEEEDQAEVPEMETNLLNTLTGTSHSAHSL